MIKSLLPIIRSKIFLFCAIVAINILVFFPSFYHAPSNTQINDLLLRPQMLNLLNFLYGLWGYNFIGWNITYFALHLMILALLYRLLLWIKDSLAAFWLTLAFSLVYIPERITIGPYLHLIVFVLIILMYYFYNRWQNQPMKTWKHLPIVLSSILSLSIVLSGAQTLRFNSLKMKAEKSATLYIVRLQNFVNRHKKEPAFSFKIVSSDADSVVTVGNQQSGKKIKGPIVYFLFRKYMKSPIPKYYVVYTRQDGLLAFINENQAQRFLKYLNVRNVK